MGIKTVNREIITSSFSIEFQSDPKVLSFKTNPDGGFMFAILPQSFSLTSSSERAFDVAMQYNFYSPVLQRINRTSITMLPCTPEHFNFSPEIL